MIDATHRVRRPSELLVSGSSVAQSSLLNRSLRCALTLLAETGFYANRGDTVGLRHSLGTILAP